jgi:signal transduction histidine kinase
MPINFPVDEPDRLLELRELEVLDGATTPALESIVHLASRNFKTPIALVSLVDADRQWFLAKEGLAAKETSRDIAFCHHAIFSDEPLIVEDALQDPRFAENPLVTGDLNIRFYAGAPIILSSGHRMGTLCVIDHEPRHLSDAEVTDLRHYATIVRDLLESRQNERRLQALIKASLDDKRNDDHFLGRIVHDLRTPLGQIMGFSELIQREAFSPLGLDEYATYISIIRESGGHMLNLIDEILAVEQAKLLAKIVYAFTSQAAGRKQKISFIDQTDGIETAIDPLALRRLMNNIISNACKYAGTGATIVVALSHIPNEDEFCIKVLDDGPGIPEAVLSQIGTPFLEGDGKPGASVSGLGLSNVAKLAAAMGCDLLVTNQPNGGAKVICFKPPH